MSIHSHELTLTAATLSKTSRLGPAYSSWSWPLIRSCRWRSFPTLVWAPSSPHLYTVRLYSLRRVLVCSLIARCLTWFFLGFLFYSFIYCVCVSDVFSSGGHWQSSGLRLGEIGKTVTECFYDPSFPLLAFCFVLDFVLIFNSVYVSETPPEVGDSGTYEPPEMGAGNQTQGFSKSIMYSNC